MWANATAKPNISEIIFASFNGPAVSATKRASRTTYLDVNVTCISKGAIGRALCGVDAIRHTEKPARNPEHSVLSENDNRRSYFADFNDVLDSAQYTSAITGGFTFEASNIEYYLLNPSTAFIDPGSRQDNFSFDRDIDIATFERRFALLLNTFWAARWSQRSIMGAKLKDDRKPVMEKWEKYRTHLLQNTTATTVFPLSEIYVVDRPWLAVHFIAVGVMISAAVVSFTLRIMCRAPQLLGYVSTLMRDSVYFEDRGTDTNSTEDGSGKSKRLGRLRIIVGDVEGREEGRRRIAFVPAEIGKRVRKERWYD